MPKYRPFWPFRWRSPSPAVIPVAGGTLPSFAQPSGYTFGEAAALVGPLLDLDPETLAGYLILAMPEDGTFRVGGNITDVPSQLALLASAIECVALALRDADGGES